MAYLIYMIDSFNMSVRPGGLLFQESLFSKPQSKTSNFSLVIRLSDFVDVRHQMTALIEKDVLRKKKMY